MKWFDSNGYNKFKKKRKKRREKMCVGDKDSDRKGDNTPKQTDCYCLVENQKVCTVQCIGAVAQ